MMVYLCFQGMKLILSFRPFSNFFTFWAYVDYLFNFLSYSWYMDLIVVWFCSALLNVNRKEEALKYLQKAAAYNPDYNVFFEHFETDPKDFTSDLANSRREF